MLNSIKSAFSKLFSNSTKPNSKLNPQNSTFEGYTLHLPDKRNGKIAHLPRDLRDRVCQCIYENASLTQLAKELNEIPQVQSMLAARFEAVPISQQNLSEWKAGGYRDWLLKRQLLDHQAETVADAQELAQTAEGLADHLFGMLTLDYAQIMMNRQKDDEATFEKKRAALSILSQDIVRLRRCSIQARRIDLQESRFESDQEKTREQVIHHFAQWARHPDIRKIFFLEPQNRDRQMRELFSLPPTKEDLALLKELGINPNSTPPAGPQTSHKPPQTENNQPPTDPVNPPKSNHPSAAPAAARCSVRPLAESGEGAVPNSKLNPQNSTLPQPTLGIYDQARAEGKNHWQALEILREKMGTPAPHPLFHPPPPQKPVTTYYGPCPPPGADHHVTSKVKTS